MEFEQFSFDVSRFLTTLALRLMCDIKYFNVFSPKNSIIFNVKLFRFLRMIYTRYYTR